MKQWIALVALVTAVVVGQEGVGVRPYELDWAERTEDDHSALVDFENLDGWTVKTKNAVASFERSREQQIWGKYVGKVVYRADGAGPEFTVRPPQPVAIPTAFDAVSLWIYGNNFLGRDKATPSVLIHLQFADSAGEIFEIQLMRMRWKEWFVCYKRLTPTQTGAVAAGGATFRGIRVTGGRNKVDRTLYFDSLAVFKEALKPLVFNPRAKRGVRVFPNRDVGVSTGEGTLPFPNRAETIVPRSSSMAKSTVRREGDKLVFETPGRLIAEVPLDSCQWDGVRLRWQGRGGWIRPAVGGGVFFAQANGNAIPPEKTELLEVKIADDRAECSWSAVAGDTKAVVRTTWWMLGQSLVADLAVEGGVVEQVRFGRAEGLENPRLVTVPYYTYGKPSRPAVAVSGTASAPLFLAMHSDWTLSNASEPFAINEIGKGFVVCNGGTTYTPKTNGVRNSCYERFVFCLAPEFVDVLPEIPNPVSPWKHITGKRVWRAHGAGNRESDAVTWRSIRRYGLQEIVVTDHETGWRDSHESFTFRTRTAPKKGGDDGQRRYARIMQDELGFTYGPYNNFTDFAPVNEFWSSDLINRRPDNQLQHAWARCYAPKPLRAVEYCEKLAPIIQQKYQFSTAYCDVHTAVTPWSRTDYDYRVPGAATFAATYYAYGEIMLLQKKAWGGPVYSEGNNHFPYCGLTDGNYAQDQRARLTVNPWLVDFDLRKMHDLCCNFGMGNIGMFFGRKAHLGDTTEEIDASIDRFLAATVAFGHPGFLIRMGGMRNTMRSYYMLQQLHERYTLASVKTIGYFDGRSLLDTSTAVASGAHARSQIATEYSDSTRTVVNGSATEPMRVTFGGRTIELPPNGYAGWTEDGLVDVFSGLVDGRRADCAVTPKYIYADGRGRFTRFPKAAADGVAVCLMLPEGQYEIIPFEGSHCGFAVEAASALALDKERKELGRAELRIARSLTHVLPVEGAFSYLLKVGTAAKSTLSCDRDEVVPGETVVVRNGETAHTLRIPQDAKPGERIWRQFDGMWIDFTVVPLCRITADVVDNTLALSILANVSNATPAVVLARGQRNDIVLRPDEMARVGVPLGVPAHERAESVTIEVRAGDLRHSEVRTIVALSKFRQIADIPSKWTSGMCLRGLKEEPIPDGTGASVSADSDRTCGGVSKDNALFMHPPYKKGEGYTFVTFEPMKLPRTPVVFRAHVGKGDGSYLGDGILFKIAVIDEDGRSTVAGERTVEGHKWLPLEGDLGVWAGKTVCLKLITDVGGNSEGDWALWADWRVETAQKEILWEVMHGAGSHFLPPPNPLPGITVKQLRTAKKGWLRYQGVGLSGTGARYGSFAYVNEIKLGNLAPAPGSERDNVWSDYVEVPLTPAAIQTLALRNVFRIDNPGEDYFKVRNFWLEVELPDGRLVSTQISADVYTQPGSWLYAEGIGVPQGRCITVDLWFRP